MAIIFLDDSVYPSRGIVPLRVTTTERQGSNSFMGKLSTQIIDTMRGQPAGGVKISLYRISEEGLEPLGSAVSNLHGSTDLPLLESRHFTSGRYQLIFSTAEYFLRVNTPLAAIPFLDDIVIRFGIADHNQDFHIPLHISPHGYSVCRG